MVGDTCPPATHRTWVRVDSPGPEENGGSVVGTWAAMNAAPGAIWSASTCQKAHYRVGNSPASTNLMRRDAPRVDCDVCYQLSPLSDI